MPAPSASSPDRNHGAKRRVGVEPVAWTPHPALAAKLDREVPIRAIREAESYGLWIARSGLSLGERTVTGSSRITGRVRRIRAE